VIAKEWQKASSPALILLCSDEVETRRIPSLLDLGSCPLFTIKLTARPAAGARCLCTNMLAV
jgi:hypothetical protein